MKQEMQALLRKEISTQEDIRYNYKRAVRFYMKESVKDDDSEESKTSFRLLNAHRNSLRSIDAKLKKLREMQKTLKSIGGFFCNGQLFDSQMNVAEVRWK